MLLVSNYHYIREDFSAKYHSIFGLTPKEFRAQLETLSGHGEFISQEELLRFTEKPFDKNYILITFDDGLKEQYELAKPILDAMGIPAVFFINTSNFQEKQVSLVHKTHLLRQQVSANELLQKILGSTPYTMSGTEKEQAVLHYNYDGKETALLKYFLNFKLNAREQEDLISPLFHQFFTEEQIVEALYFDTKMLQDLSDSKSLGSHSHQHRSLGRMNSNDLKTELRNTQAYFMKHFGRPADTISYPYGAKEDSLGISSEVKAAGFKIGFTMERAFNKSLLQDSLLLSRYDCNDLPSGKNDLFIGASLFQNQYVRKWYHHENNFINQ